MKILEINSYKDKSLNRFKVFFINDITFKYSSRKLFKSEVPADYYTTELARALKP